MQELINQLRLQVKRQWVLINAVPGGELEPLVAEEVARQGLEPVVIIPYDEEVYQYDLQLKPLPELLDTSQAVIVIDEFMTKLTNQIMAKGVK
jgi:CO dehydrogenase maturation factor